MKLDEILDIADEMVETEVLNMRARGMSIPEISQRTGSPAAVVLRLAHAGFARLEQKLQYLKDSNPAKYQQAIVTLRQKYNV